jgi:hypothetical protein
MPKVTKVFAARNNQLLSKELLVALCPEFRFRFLSFGFLSLFVHGSLGYRYNNGDDSRLAAAAGEAPAAAGRGCRQVRSLPVFAGPSCRLCSVAGASAGACLCLWLLLVPACACGCCWCLAGTAAAAVWQARVRRPAALSSSLCQHSWSGAVVVVGPGAGWCLLGVSWLCLRLRRALSGGGDAVRSGFSLPRACGSLVRFGRKPSPTCRSVGMMAKLLECRIPHRGIMAKHHAPCRAGHSG